SLRPSGPARPPELPLGRRRLGAARPPLPGECPGGRADGDRPLRCRPPGGPHRLGPSRPRPGSRRRGLPRRGARPPPRLASPPEGARPAPPLFRARPRACAGRGRAPPQEPAAWSRPEEPRRRGRDRSLARDRRLPPLALGLGADALSRTPPAACPPALRDRDLRGGGRSRPGRGALRPPAPERSALPRLPGRAPRGAGGGRAPARGTRTRPRPTLGRRPAGPRGLAAIEPRAGSGLRRLGASAPRLRGTAAAGTGLVRKAPRPGRARPEPRPRRFHPKPGARQPGSRPAVLRRRSDGRRPLSPAAPTTPAPSPSRDGQSTTGSTKHGHAGVASPFRAFASAMYRFSLL